MTHSIGTSDCDSDPGAPTIVNVGKQGFQFTTISAALAVIVDSSVTNRYQIIIYPGDYDEQILISSKSYISFVGIDRNICRIRGASSQASVLITGTSNVTGISFKNLTIGGAIPVSFSLTLNTPTDIKFDSCTFGIIDGTENSASGKSVDGIVDSTGGRTITVTNCIFNSTWDCIRIAGQDLYYGTGNIFNIDDKGATNATMRPWSTQGKASQLYETGPQVFITASGSSTTEISLVESNPGTAGSTIGNVIDINDLDATITTTNNSRTGNTNVVYLKTAAANTTASEINISGRVIMSATDAGSALSGIKVDASANHSNWTIRWIAGRLSMSGGASRNDINNAETVGGFSINLFGVEHSGSYTGAGSITSDKVLKYISFQASGVTFGAAATAGVTLPVAFSAADYTVCLEPTANETFWVTSKTASGFTVNSSNAASTAAIRYVVTR